MPPLPAGYHGPVHNLHLQVTPGQPSTHTSVDTYCLGLGFPGLPHVAGILQYSRGWRRTLHGRPRLLLASRPSCAASTSPHPQMSADMYAGCSATQYGLVLGTFAGDVNLTMAVCTSLETYLAGPSTFQADIKYGLDTAWLISSGALGEEAMRGACRHCVARTCPSHPRHPPHLPSTFQSSRCTLDSRW